ncbi:HAMP domain-containing sensor histidine kinase [Proteinivorax tanatarense]|uniref:histidine kinase n=1 Tax=Proteinivorax tanatarense TaxID=1260629 RepID=A0AAU7VKV0_9FIRM
MLQLLANSEIKLFLKGMLILFIVFTILIVAILNFGLQSLHKENIDNNIAIMGNILYQFPELEGDIPAFFTKEPTPEAKEVGLNVAKQYGYTRDMPLVVSTPFENHKKVQTIKVVIPMSILFILFMAVTLFLLNNLYKRLRSYSEHVDNIADGNLKVIESKDKEGDIAKLNHSFNKMTKAMSTAQQKEWKEKLLHKNIISDISHQLKTPLSSIKVFNGLILDSPSLSSDIKEFSHKIEQQSERMEWLTKNLLIIARLETKSLPLNNKSKDINQTVEKVLKTLKDNWQKKDLNISTTLKEKILFPHDEKWLGEAITNVVKNAIEHTEVGGNISIKTLQSPITVKIQVSDSGAGILPEEKPHIFERFYKGKYNTKKNSTGIGLALAKGIVENHGGVINVTSKEGQGSIFTITLFKDESI